MLKKVNFQGFSCLENLVHLKHDIPTTLYKQCSRNTVNYCKSFFAKIELTRLLNFDLVEFNDCVMYYVYLSIDF